jgi:hypothetical protein
VNRKDASKILGYLEKNAKAPGHVIYPAMLGQRLNLTPKRVEKVLESWRGGHGRDYQMGWVHKSWSFIDDNDDSFEMDEDEAEATLAGHYELRHPVTREVAKYRDPKRYIRCTYLTTDKFFAERIQVKIDAAKQERARKLVRKWLKRTYSADEIPELIKDESYYLLEQMIASELSA